MRTIPAGYRSSILRMLLLLVFTLASLTWLRAAPPARALSRTNLLFYQSGAGTIEPVRTPAEWRKRRASILLAMQEVMGQLPGTKKRCPLHATVEEETDCGGFVRRLVNYQSEPGGKVPAYLLIPKALLAGKLKAPAVLALHQTHPLGQKVVVGLGNSTNDEYGLELVKRGFVVFAPPYPWLADYNPDLKGLGYQSGTMKAIWDNMRALDYLESLPFVKTNGFGAIGHSLGGHNSIFTAVFDERIQVIVSSCGFDSFRDYKNGSIKGWTSERYMPRLLNYSLDDLPFDFHELIGSLAPRRCFISAPLRDDNFKWWSVDAVVQSALPIYNLLGAPDHLELVHPDCAHGFPSEVRARSYQAFESLR